MKRKIILCFVALVVLAICGFIASPRRPLPPEIRFQRFEYVDSRKKDAVFLISNRSKYPFSYVASAPSIPSYKFHSWKTSGESGDSQREADGGGISDQGIELFTIPPESSIEVKTKVFWEAPENPSRVRVGIYFAQGTKHDLRREPGIIRKFLIHCRILEEKGSQGDYSWSDDIPQ